MCCSGNSATSSSGSVKAVAAEPGSYRGASNWRTSIRVREVEYLRALLISAAPRLAERLPPEEFGQLLTRFWGTAARAGRDRGQLCR